MADLSGYAPIYIRTTGNDTTGDGSSGSPYATAQKGYDIAMAAGSGNYVLDFGIGSFGGVLVAASWPARIAVRGVSSSQSNIGGIDASGVDGFYADETETAPTASRAVTIVSDKSVNLGIVDASGGSYDTGASSAAGTAGSAISLTDCVCGEVTSTGGSAAFNGGANAGAVTLTNCIVSGNVSANGGAAAQSNTNGGNAAAITLTDTSVSGNVSASGGVGYGVAANITMTRCSVGDISCNGSGQGYNEYDNGSSAGNVTLADVTCGQINANGGNGGSGDYSTVTTGGVGGTISVTNGTVGSISASGGSGNNGIAATSGGVTLAGIGNVPDSIVASSVTLTNLKRGRGVNGSSILGVA